MSINLMTQSNINNISSSGCFKHTKLSKFNKFYLSSNNFSFKKESLIKSPSLKNNLFNSITHMTPFKLIRTKTQTNLINSKYLNSTSKSNKIIYNSWYNSKKIKNKFNPEILETQYISRPKKRNKKININIPSRNTFLCNKKTKTLNLNTFNYINDNKYKIISSSFFKKPIFNKHLIDIKIKNKLYRKKNDSICESMKRLIEKANKSSKKANSIMINQFEKKLIYDKRENLKEYDKFMNELTTNLNLSKSKLKINKIYF